MFDKMLGVSPTQKGLAQDSKAVDKETLQPDFKKDFERQLQKKLDEKVKASTREEPQKPKSPEAKKSEDELRADRNIKKPSGGTKKKMVESEDVKIVSNVMASIESEVETPNPDKDLAEIEVDGRIEVKTETQSQATEDTLVRSGPAVPQDVVQAYPEAQAQGVSQNLSEVAPSIPGDEQLQAEVQASLQGQVAPQVPTESTSQSDLSLVEGLSQQQSPSTVVPREQSLSPAIESVESKSLNTEALKPQQTGPTQSEALKAQDLTKQNVEPEADLQGESALPNTQAVNGSLAPGMIQVDGSQLGKVQEQGLQAQPMKADGLATGIAPVEDLQAKLMAARVIQADPLAQPIESQALPTQAPQKELSFEEQLGQDVGFTSDLKQHVAAAGLVEKMKEFGVDKKSTSETANAFEQKVLAQLQQEGTFAAKTSESPNQEQSGFSQHESSDTMKDSSSELKSEGVKPEVQLHAGASHPDFKAHLSTPIEKAGSLTPMAQLLENKDENVSEIMKQAQFLAVKGGGEMNVKMSPDGMGEIQLKVLMQDGKINIEMQTQDKNVKKLIEDSLSELKSGLAAQQLNVDHVKISTVNATNTENSAQFQSNLSHGQGGEANQQKDFWKSFQENLGQQSRNRSAYGEANSVGSRAQSNVNSSQAAKTAAIRSYGRTGATLNRVA